MSNVGRRYAKAIYELAAQDKIEERVGKELADVSTMWETSADFRMVFENPRMTADLRKKVLTDIATRGVFSAVTKNSLAFIADRGRMQNLGDISRAYQVISEEHGGALRAEVTTATALPEVYFAELTRALEKVTGKRVRIEKRVDPTLIAGVVTKIGDKIYDGSLRNRFNEMKTELLGQ